VRGLELAESYYWDVGDPMITEKFPEYSSKVAAGLVGEGSECFGYDDELSQDHDWGPAFCLWLNHQDYLAIGNSLQIEYDKLPKEFAGFTRQESQWGGGRIGVFETGAFYKGFIGFDHVPGTIREWRAIPESYLALATNGKVFKDDAGQFTEFRNKLKAFYPEDLRLKKMASRCMNIAQYGQYNFPRCIQRKEYVAASFAESQFINYIISLVYLINREYKPFFKWMHRDMQRLSQLGQSTHKLILDLVTPQDAGFGKSVYDRKIELIEEASQCIIRHLRDTGLSTSESDYLADHGPMLQAKIQDPELRNLNVWAE
jgi:hypothetical protein